MAAPFSAIIMVGALVLPDVIVGITEASITRKPSTPMTRRWASTTALAFVRRSHLGGSHRMEDRRCVRPEGGKQGLIIVVARVRPGPDQDGTKKV